MRAIYNTAVLMFLVPNLALSAMASPNYKIQSDVVSFGGNKSSSSNYNVEDTLGEVATGSSSSTNYKLNAGFWQMQNIFISVSSPADVTLSPDINGLTGGTGDGSATWTVITDNVAGYEMYIKSDSSPAMSDGSGNSFSDYTPTGSNPDYNWSVSSTSSGFGFTPEGSDIVQKYKDDGVSCNTGTLDTQNTCWTGFSTTNELISKSTTANHPSGTDTLVRFRAESGNQNILPNGSYTASIIVTVLPL